MTEEIKHINKKNQEYIAEGNRMTKETKIGKKDVVACNYWEACDYYKQLKRLEQENKELRNKNICRETCEYFKRICNDNTLLIKYRSALEEINRIVKLAHKVEDYLLGQDYTDLVDRIEKEINEVLNDK